MGSRWGIGWRGQPPPFPDNDEDFDEEPEEKTDDGARACPECQAIFAPGVISCECGWTPQRKERKRRQDEARQAAGLLNITYEERFSDRGVRPKKSDVEREYRHYYKRALKVSTVKAPNGEPMKFFGVADRWNRDPDFKEQMSSRGFTYDHAKEMDRLGRENPDARAERKQPGRRT